MLISRGTRAADLAVMLVRRAGLFFVFACLFQYLGIHRRDSIYELRRKSPRCDGRDTTSVSQTIRRIEAYRPDGKISDEGKPGGNLLGNHARELQTSRAASLIFNLIINAKLRIKLSTHKSCGRKKLWETPIKYVYSWKIYR